MIKTNRLDAGPVDSPVTASSTEESGDILPFFFVGRALAVNGGTNIVYTRDLADKGVPISVKMTPTTTGSYIRWMFPRTYGRFVVRRAFMRTEELTGPLTLIEVRHGVTGATVGRLQLTAEGEPVLTVGIDRHLATRGQAIPLNTLVWVEYAINTDIQTAEYRITDNEGAVLSSMTHINSGYLTGPVSDVRFGSTVDQWQAVDYIAGIQAGSLASGWLGPISQSVPLPTPRPWVTRVKTPTLGQTDGEISIAWYPVYGAASYRVVLDDDEILPVTGNTHTFTGVPPGEHRISVQAIAGPPPPRAVFVHELTGSNLAVDATKTTGAVSYAWAFGDGETSTQGPTTTHTYAAPGTYKVTLAVSDSMGRTSTFSRLITIEAAEIPNVAPVAEFSSNAHGLEVAFDGSASTDTDGSIVSYAWEFGDNATGTGATASHEYAAAGTYNVKLTVTDNRGATASVTQPVTVVEPIIYGPSPLGSAGAVALDPSDAIHLPSGMASAGVVTLSPPSTVVAPSRLGSAGTTVLEEPEGSFMPRRFATLDEAKTALNLPTDATYITWDAAAAQTGQSDLWRICKQLPINTILVLPERTDPSGDPIPYPIDGTRGFMTHDGGWITGFNGENTVATGAQPLVQESGLWMQMARAQRGIIGLGPNSVLKIVGVPATPIQRLPISSTAEVRIYRPDGASSVQIGNPYCVVGANHPKAVFANFVCQDNDLGGVAYDFLRPTSTMSSSDPNYAPFDPRVAHMHFDGCHRGYTGWPPDETAAVHFKGGTYTFKNSTITLKEDGSSTSPIMWSLCTGGLAENIRISGGKVKAGMCTMWDCRNLHTHRRVQYIGDAVALNLEGNYPSFVLAAEQCDFKMTRDAKSVHFQIDPSRGPIGVNLTGCTFQDVRVYTPGEANVQTYGTAGVQPKTSITCNNRPVKYHGATTNWAP